MIHICCMLIFIYTDAMPKQLYHDAYLNIFALSHQMSYN